MQRFCISKTPIAYVAIYNNGNNTISNEEGRFVFYSELDSIHIKMLGYKNLKTTFENVKKRDTILLTQISFLLDKVVVFNSKKILDKAWQNRFKKYPNIPYKEKFFIRSVFKRNNEIESLADFYGKVGRNATFRNEEEGVKKIDYTVELLNLRKARVVQQKEIKIIRF